MRSSAGFDFGLDAIVSAHAKGAPGQRTFYLDFSDSQTHVRVWLEKQELQGLGLAIEHVADELADAPPASDSELVSAAAELTTAPGTEFKATKITVSYAKARRVVVLVVEGEPEEQTPTRVTCLIPPLLMRALSQQIYRVCAAGRPICPLCQGPINPQGHICPKANGHGQTLQR